MKIGLILSACILLSSHPAWSQGVQPTAVALTPAIQINQGVISQPLLLKVTGVGTSTPFASLPIQFSTDTTDLVLIDQSGATDATGQASATCIGLRPGTGHVIAMLPTGGLLKFSVTVAAPSPAAPQLNVSEIGRMVWQGTSTLDSSNAFAATLTNSAGVPTANTAVLVSVLRGNVQLLDGTGAAADTLSLVTQPDGSFAFNCSFPPTSSPDDFSVIGLSAQGSSSVFLVHAFPKNAPPVLRSVSSSTNAPILLTDGSASATPIQLTLVDANNQGVAGVTVDLVATADRQAGCAETLLITAGDGSFTCHPLVKGKAGTGAISFLFGQQLVSPAFAYSAQPSAVALIRQLSGNYQAGSSGQLLSKPLQVQLIDAFGNPVAGSPVTWQSNDAAIVSSSSISDASGLASATVELSMQPGSMSATASVGGVSAIFTITNISSGRLVKSAGDGQVATVHSTFQQLLQVRLLNAAGQVAALQVIQFAVNGGEASLNAPSAITDSNGYASIAVTAGNTAGIVSIQATAPADTTTFVLSVVNPLTQTLNVGDANGRSGGLTPGAIVTLRFAASEALGDSSEQFNSAPYPTQVQGFAVKMNGVAAPILSVGAASGEMQLSVQVPWEIDPSTRANVVLTRSDLGVIVPDTEVIATRPVILSSGIARVLRTARGEALTLQVTGMGQYTPRASTNSAGLPGQTLNQPFRVLMDGQPVTISHFSPNPELSGLLNVALRLPGATTGVHTFVVEMQGVGGWTAGPPTDLQLR